MENTIDHFKEHLLTQENAYRTMTDFMRHMEFGTHMAPDFILAVLEKDEPLSATTFAKGLPAFRNFAATFNFGYSFENPTFSKIMVKLLKIFEHIYQTEFAKDTTLPEFAKQILTNLDAMIHQHVANNNFRAIGFSDTYTAFEQKELLHLDTLLTNPLFTKLNEQGYLPQYENTLADLAAIKAVRIPESHSPMVFELSLKDLEELTKTQPELLEDFFCYLSEFDLPAARLIYSYHLDRQNYSYPIYSLFKGQLENGAKLDVSDLLQTRGLHEKFPYFPFSAQSLESYLYELFSTIDKLPNFTKVYKIVLKHVLLFHAKTLVKHQVLNLPGQLTPNFEHIQSVINLELAPYFEHFCDEVGLGYSEMSAVQDSEMQAIRFYEGTTVLEFVETMEHFTPVLYSGVFFTLTLPMPQENGTHDVTYTTNELTDIYHVMYLLLEHSVPNIYAIAIMANSCYLSYEDYQSYTRHVTLHERTLCTLDSYKSVINFDGSNEQIAAFAMYEKILAYQLIDRMSTPTILEQLLFDATLTFPRDAVESSMNYHYAFTINKALENELAAKELSKTITTKAKELMLHYAEDINVSIDRAKCMAIHELLKSLYINDIPRIHMLIFGWVHYDILATFAYLLSSEHAFALAGADKVTAVYQFVQVIPEVQVTPFNSILMNYLKEQLH